MKQNKKRGLLATVGAFVAASALLIGGSVAANAAPAQPAPESSNVIITKLSQPAVVGSAATGVQNNSIPADATPIAGVIFDYFLVTDTQNGGSNDIGTNAGQQYAASLTPASAALVATNVTGSFPATAVNGQTTVSDMPRGLYLVKEDPATVPAGVTPAAPFLLAVPMTNPSTVSQEAGGATIPANSEWLNTIYVYPKNSQIDATKTVSNADKLVVGDNVTWTIDTATPKNIGTDVGGNPTGSFVAPDAFRISDTFDPAELSVVGDPVVKLGTVTLVKDTDYTVDSVGNEQQVNFNAAGLAKIATAQNGTEPDVRISVEWTTTVVVAGVHINSARIYADQTAITDDNPMSTGNNDLATVKYGSYKINKISSDSNAELAGAVFRVYASEAAALAAGNDFLTTAENSAGEWTTDANGTVQVGGLRYTDFADGKTQTKFISAPGETCVDLNAGPASAECLVNPKFQEYWLVEVTAPTDHQLLAEPVKFEVTEVVSSNSGTITNVKTAGGFVLPLTGGMGTAFLTIIGAGILGFVLVAARRRRSAEAQA